jgi:serine/threonine protein kinase
MCIDFNRPSLTTSYINGKPLSDILVKRGELLHTSTCDSLPDLEGLSRREQIKLGILSARPFLHEIIDQQFVNHAFKELAKIHAARLIWNDIKYGNIIVEKCSGKPYLIDFDHARYYPRLLSPLFKLLCENDAMKLRIRLSFDSEVFKNYQ